MGSVEVTSIDPVKLVGPLDHAGRGKYRRQFLCADRFRSQAALLQSLKLFGGDLHHQVAILVLGFDRLQTRGNESAGRASPPAVRAPVSFPPELYHPLRTRKTRT